GEGQGSVQEDQAGAGGRQDPGAGRRGARHARRAGREVQQAQGQERCGGCHRRDRGGRGRRRRRGGVTPATAWPAVLSLTAVPNTTHPIEGRAGRSTRGTTPLSPRRRATLCALALLLAAALPAGAHAFGLDDVAKRAQELAA